MMRHLRLVMARFRRRQSMSPINSNKEILDSTLLGVGAAVNSLVTVATAINDYVGTVGTVPIGSTIRGVYLFVAILPTAGTANVDWYLIKGNTATVGAAPVAGATGGDVNRRFILHEEKGIPGNAADGAYPATFKGFIAIPKGRQRMGEGDLIRVVLRGTDIHNICIKCIYKRFT